MKFIATAIVALFAASAFATGHDAKTAAAPGTATAAAPKAEAKVDCKDMKNKDHKDCKKH
jgi:hypothetical protein